MSATLEALAVSRGTRLPQHRFGPWALARTEGGRLVRHPVTWFGIALSLVTFLLNTWWWAPVLQSDDVLTGFGLLPLAGATFLVVNLAVTRSRRHGTDDLYESVPVGAEGRTVGHLLSIVYPVSIGVVLVAAMMGVRLLQDSVGSPDAIELVTGPVIVGLAGVIAVAAGRWWPRGATGPVILVALAAGQMLMQFQHASGGIGPGKPARWLALWVPMAASGQPARELVARPSRWHLVYLGALGVVVASVAVLRHRPRVRVAVILAGAVAITVLVAAIEVRGATNDDARRMAELLRHPGRHQVCETRMGVRYCAFPPYRGWIDRWAGAIEPILATVPSDAGVQGIEVTQTLILYGSDAQRVKGLPLANTAGQTSYAESADLGSAIRPSSQWGRGSKEGGYQLGIDLVVAAMEVRLPRRPQDIRWTPAEIRSVTRHMQPPDRKAFLATTKPGDPMVQCSALGQARAVVALWLAASATDGTRSAFLQDIQTNVQLHHQGPETDVGPWFYPETANAVPMFNFPVQWAEPEATYAKQLLAMPRGSVSEVIRANWARLTDPATSSDDVARLFGLRVLPSLASQARSYDPTVVACR